MAADHKNQGNTDKTYRPKSRKKHDIAGKQIMFESLQQYIAGMQAANSRRRYTTVLKDFYNFMGNDFSAITENDVFDYYDYLKQKAGIDPRGQGTKALSGRTLRNQMFALRAMFGHLKRRGIILINPFESACIRLPKEEWNEKRPTEIIPFEEVLELANAPSRMTVEGIRDRAMLAVLLGGALRASEARMLKVSDIRTLALNNRDTVFYAHLRATKAGKAADQALPAWAVERVVRALEVRRSEGGTHDDPLFTQYRGAEDAPTNTHISEHTLMRIFQSWREFIGLPDTITLHSCRATAIAYLFDRKIPHREIQKFARHSSIETTMVYDRRHFGVENSVASEVTFR